MSDRLPFEFPNRWESLDIGASREVVARLADRDRALEDHLATLGAGGKPYATIVIAASDSTAADKASADYVCDGTADQVEINAACAALPVNKGGRVLLLEGTFNIAAGIELADGATEVRRSLAGMGQGSRIVAVFASSDAVIYANGDYCHIADLSITTNVPALGFAYGISASGDDLVVENVVVNGGTYAMNLHGQRTYVRNCTVHGATTEAFLVDGNYSTISGCGVFTSGGTAYDLGHFSTVTGCVADATGAATSPNVGVQIRNRSVVTGCVINAYNNGIYHGTTLGGVIADNVIIAPKSHGIELDGDDCVVTGNLVDGTGSAGTAGTMDGIHIVGDRNNVQGNTVRHGSELRYGINLSAVGAADNLVSNNDLKNSGLTASLNDAGTGTITAAGNRL